MYKIHLSIISPSSFRIPSGSTSSMKPLLIIFLTGERKHENCMKYYLISRVNSSFEIHDKSPLFIPYHPALFVRLVSGEGCSFPVTFHLAPDQIPVNATLAVTVRCSLGSLQEFTTLPLHFLPSKPTKIIIPLLPCFTSVFGILVSLKLEIPNVFNR